MGQTLAKTCLESLDPITSMFAEGSGGQVAEATTQTARETETPGKQTHRGSDSRGEGELNVGNRAFKDISPATVDVEQGGAQEGLMGPNKRSRWAEPETRPKGLLDATGSE